MQTEHAEETRELAYELWAFSCSRNAKAVALELYTKHEREVPVRTVQDWVRRYGWLERLNAELAELAPAIHRENLAELLLLSRDAIHFQRSVYRMEAAEPGRATRVYGKALGPLMTGAMGAQDRAGYGPLGRITARANEIDNPSMVRVLENLDELDDADVLALDAQLVADDIRRAERERAKR